MPDLNEHGFAGMPYAQQASTSTGWNDPSRCVHCGAYHSTTCPRIESIEYYGNGAVKKITLRGPFVMVAPTREQP